MTQVIEEEHTPVPLVSENPNEAEYNKHVSIEYRVPWKNVQKAIDHGYIIPGYNVQKYIRSTWEGIKNWQRPEDKTVKMAFHMIDVWGRQGCLSGETEIITNEGITRLSDLTEGKEFALPSYRNGALESDIGVMVNSRVQMLYLVKTEVGSTYATDEHPFLTTKGWMTTSQLRRGIEIVYMPQNTTRWNVDIQQDLRMVQAGISYGARQMVLHHGLPSKVVWSSIQRSPAVSRITCQDERRPEKIPNRRAALRNMWNPIQSPELLQATILLQKLRDEAQEFSSWKSDEERRNKNQIQECDDGDLDARTKGEPCEDYEVYVHRASCLRASHDENATGTWQGPRASKEVEQRFEEIVRGTSREALFTQDAKELHDITGKESRADPRRLGYPISLEQSTSCGWKIVADIPRLSVPNLDEGDRDGWDMVPYRGEQGSGSPTASMDRSQRIQGLTTYSRPNRESLAGFPKFAKVISVEPVGKDRTFNLHVMKNNNFILENGIVTHNSGKSSLVLLLMYQQYKDWDTVLKRIILTKEDLVKSYAEIRGLFQRIPVLCLDDLTTMIPKQLWFVDKDLHILIQQFIAVARTKIGTLVTTLPNVEFTWETLGEVVTMEIIVYPNQKYQAQLYCWDSHAKFPLKARFDKIVIESAHFDVSWIPQDVWKQYRERRESIADVTFQKLADYIEGKKTPEAKSEARKQVGSILRKMPNGAMMDVLRANGIKIEGNNGNKAMTALKQLAAETFGSDSE